MGQFVHNLGEVKLNRGFIWMRKCFPALDERLCYAVCTADDESSRVSDPNNYGQSTCERLRTAVLMKAIWDSVTMHSCGMTALIFQFYSLRSILTTSKGFSANRRVRLSATVDSQ
jgi:hypothetical protein